MKRGKTVQTESTEALAQLRNLKGNATQYNNGKFMLMLCTELNSDKAHTAVWESLEYGQ